MAEYTTCTMSELKLNAETFRWMERIPPILDEHADIISRSRREAEEGLKVRLCTIMYIQQSQIENEIQSV